MRPRYQLGQAPRARARLWRGKRFVLRTDVNQFYSSIYTHSIPWALHGKAAAKASIGKKGKNALVGDKLDRAFQIGSHGQTAGIPIGPDSALSSPNWVLAYEASVRGWLEGAATRVDADPFFRTLAKLNVRFYDTDPPTAPFTGPAGPMPGSSLPDDYL